VDRATSPRVTSSVGFGTCRHGVVRPFWGPILGMVAVRGPNDSQAKARGGAVSPEDAAKADNLTPCNPAPVFAWWRHEPSAVVCGLSVGASET
jgi:hypothetical protein